MKRNINEVKNELKKKKKVRECQRNQKQFFKKIIKMYTHLARLMKKKCEETQISKIKRGSIPLDLTMLKGY